MAEYIDRNRLIKKFCNHCYFDVGEKNCAEDCYDMKIIKSLPTEDVAPVLYMGRILKRNIRHFSNVVCVVAKTGILPKLIMESTITAPIAEQ